MPTIGTWLADQGARVDALSDGLGHTLNRAVPPRLRRIVEKMQTGRQHHYGQVAAIGFLGATILYGLIAGGHMLTLLDRTVAAAFFGIQEIRIGGEIETPESAVVDQLDIRGGSLLGFDASDARERLIALPWVKDADIRKFYPNRLDITLTERTPFALWQNDEVISIIDRTGVVIGRYKDVRFAGLPFVVGKGADSRADGFMTMVQRHPFLAERMRTAVLVSERRWDLVTKNGITVQLPENGVDEAIDRLKALQDKDDVLSREIVTIDLRLKDRIRIGLADNMAETVIKENESVIRRLAKAGGEI
ncbi:cell division protein FtsQ/DivIB [Afifella aestuarii]|uniref:cell division protein FtsQ/DivIB n=1 Tax=Afifella aestuarii TaxID=1909496 RepID=UPI000FE379FD|nr:cell division protein FtsQ/DivIB [Afifella aestuarii]